MSNTDQNQATDRTEEIAKAGKPICILQDRRTVGFYVSLRDFSPEQELRKFLADNPRAGQDHQGAHHFLQRLIGDGLLLKVKFGTLDLGPHGHVNDARFTAA